MHSRASPFAERGFPTWDTNPVPLLPPTASGPNPKAISLLAATVGSPDRDLPSKPAFATLRRCYCEPSADGHSRFPGSSASDSIRAEARKTSCGMNSAFPAVPSPYFIWLTILPNFAMEASTSGLQRPAQRRMKFRYPSSTLNNTPDEMKMS